MQNDGGTIFHYSQNLLMIVITEFIKNRNKDEILVKFSIPIKMLERKNNFKILSLILVLQSVGLEGFVDPMKEPKVLELYVKAHTCVRKVDQIKLA